MKRALCALIAAVLLTACVQEAPPPTKIVAGGGQRGSSEAAASAGEEPEASGLLEAFLRDLEDAAFDLFADCPETEGELYQFVRVDEEFSQRVAKILTDNTSKPAQSPKSEGRMLTLRLENGDVAETAYFHGYDAKDPDFPDQMLLELELDDGRTGTYLFDKKAFEQLDALYRERTEGVKTEFTGNITLITPKYDLKRIRDEQGYETNEFLQFGTRLLWRFTPHADGYLQPSTVEMLDTVTGGSIYSSTISENVIRMEKYDGEPGFDYRLITPTGILYRSSADRSREQVWRLPGIVSLFSASEELSGSFDMQNGKLAYASGDGVYLADEDGGNAQPVLFHSALSEVMRSAAGAGYTYYFNDPHFLLGGKRLVTAIVSPQTGQRRLGFAVTNLDSMETSYFTGATAADGGSVRYLSDKVVAAQDEGVVTLINAENYDRGALPLNGLEGSLFLTHDCKSFAVWEPKVSGTTAYSSSMYLCGNQNISDRSKKLLGSYGGEYRPVGITEEYIIGVNEDSRGLLMTATRYKTAARPVSQPSSSEESASSGSSAAESEEEDDGEGTLPPDITPDL